jgi:hypothetical protein
VRLAAEIALVVLAGIGLAVCVALIPAGPTRRPRARPAPPSPRPGQLVALERMVVTAGASAVQVHAYLRPRLIEITAYRLAARGQTLDWMPADVGRELLGDRLWDIVRPGRPFPEDRNAPGVRPPELAAMLAVLERL